MKYQIFILGPAQSQFRTAFTTALEQGVTDIGLDYTADVEVLGAKDQIDWDGTPIALWFGNGNRPDQQDLEMLDDILNEHMPVFPVVEDLDHYRELVPSSLHRINAHLWKSDAPVGLTTLVGNILGVLRL